MNEWVNGSYEESEHSQCEEGHKGHAWGYQHILSAHESAYASHRIWCCEGKKGKSEVVDRDCSSQSIVTEESEAKHKGKSKGAPEKP